MTIIIFDQAPVSKEDVIKNINEMIHLANKYQSAVDDTVFSAENAIKMINDNSVITDEMLESLGGEEGNILQMSWQDVFYALPENQPEKHVVKLEDGQSFLDF